MSHVFLFPHQDEPTADLAFEHRQEKSATDGDAMASAPDALGQRSEIL